jgi:F-type H+-transporting ATPase subunit b
MIRRIAIALGGGAALVFGLAGAAVAQHEGHETGHEAAAEHAAAGHDEQAEAAHGGEHHAPPPVNWIDFGYAKKDVHGGTLDAGDEPMAPPLVAALLNFGIFAFLIIKFGGPKIAGYLRTRHDTIKHDLAEAARLRAEAAAKLAEYSTRVASINAEVDQMIGEIRADAEAEKARILADARAQADALKKDASDRIASEIARARLELEQEVVAAAVGAAERILRQNTTAADQTALFDGFVASLAAPRPGSKPTPSNPPPSGAAPDEGWT